jgi:competence protein ComFC
MQKRTFSALRELVFPDVCCLCGDAFDYFLKDAIKIYLDGDMIESPYCETCTRALMNGYCNESTKRFYKTNSEFLFDYNYEAVQKAISHLKRVRCRKCNEFFAKILSSVLKNKDFEYISYIPRSKIALKKYDFDQSERIISTFVRLSPDHKAIDLLTRSRKHSVQQKSLSAKNRFINAKGSLILRKNARIPNNFVLFDDVTTTGATAQTAIDILKKGGAEKINLIFLAKTRKILKERSTEENE